MCGGTLKVTSAATLTHGLSPRVRGNRERSAGAGQWPRSIPACAGEPDYACPAHDAGWVYPRVCGGTAPRRGPWRIFWGLSPRVRGNPGRTNGLGVATGSIPACAGEPRQPNRVCNGLRVYPRVCGGTIEQRANNHLAAGLSPRVRGNRQILFPFLTGAGSIPACAGEPWDSIRRASRTTVYPRVCGGTRWSLLTGRR